MEDSLRSHSASPSIVLTEKEITRFWKKVQKSEVCWEWKRYRNEHGYGVFRFRDTLVLAHRLSFAIHFGSFPINCACHRCDNPACVNPEHLFDGTQQDNIKDMLGKGRFKASPGERNGSAVLSDKDVIWIKFRLEMGELQQSLADEYDVSQATISRIKLGKRLIAW
jgi:hypothetical protein